MGNELSGEEGDSPKPETYADYLSSQSQKQDSKSKSRSKQSNQPSHNNNTNGNGGNTRRGHTRTSRSQTVTPQSHRNKHNHLADRGQHQRHHSTQAASIFPNLSALRQVSRVWDDDNSDTKDSSPSSHAEVNLEQLDIFQQRFVEKVAQICQIPTDIAIIILQYLHLSGISLKTIRGHKGPILATCTLPNGWVATGSADCTIRFWNPSGGCEAGWSAHHTAVISLAVVTKTFHRPRTRNWQIASGSAGGNLKIWDFDERGNSECVLVHNAASSLTSLCELRPGYLACGSDYGEVSIWHLDQGEHKVLGTHQSKVSGLVRTHDNNLISCSKDGTIIIWDPEAFFDHQIHMIRAHKAPIVSIDHLKAHRLVSVAWDKTCCIWDTELYRKLGSFKIDIPQCMKALPDGRVATGGLDGLIKLWDPISGRCHASLKGHKLGVKTLSVLEDHKIASGGQDGALILWS